MALPTEMSSLNNISPGKADIQRVPLPQVTGTDRLLVRVTAVGLNPTDWKHIEFTAVAGLRTGCDYAGVVEEAGSKVTKSFKKGDRVAGVTHGSNQSNKNDGAFAEFVAAKGDLAIKIPKNITDEQAASLGVGVSTVGQGLYQRLQLPLPASSATVPPASIPLLIYGGSTATGMLSIQFAVLSGCRVIAACSPSHFDMVRSLGAAATVDSHLTADGQIRAIRAFAGNDLRHAWDPIASPESSSICASALSPDGGRYSATGPVDEAAMRAANPGIASVDSVLAYTVLGEKFDKFGMVFEPVPADDEFGKIFWELARGLLATGRVAPIKIEVNRGGKGLEGVQVGLREMKEGKVSGRKLVYTL